MLVNVFMSGGNTDSLYGGDGRLRMARSLEQLWPGVVTVAERWGRPQHVVDWGRFRAPLVPRDGFDPSKLPRRDELGLDLVAVRDVESAKLHEILDHFHREAA